MNEGLRHLDIDEGDRGSDRETGAEEVDSIVECEFRDGGLIW